MFAGRMVYHDVMIADRKYAAMDPMPMNEPNDRSQASEPEYVSLSSSYQYSFDVQRLIPKKSPNFEPSHKTAIIVV